MEKNDEVKMETHEDYFSENNLKLFVIEKVVKLEDYRTLFDIYCYVRRRLQ